MVIDASTGAVAWSVLVPVPVPPLVSWSSVLPPTVRAEVSVVPSVLVPVPVPPRVSWSSVLESMVLVEVVASWAKAVAGMMINAASNASRFFEIMTFSLVIGSSDDVDCP